MRSTSTVLALAVTVLLVATGCSETASVDESGEPAAAPTTGGGTVTMTAEDYAYPEAPSEVAAGTTIQLDNASDGEVHEVLALRVADDEDRPADELMSLPPEEVMQVVEVRGAALAPPEGSSADIGMPPLVVEQPGRYVFACLIPTGAPPEEVLQAVRDFAESGATEGEPDYPQTGPPHAANGMFTEVTVTAG